MSFRLTATLSVSLVLELAFLAPSLLLPKPEPAPTVLVASAEARSEAAAPVENWIVPVAETVTAPEAQNEDVQVGTASWYGIHWQGRRTASGVRFDVRKLTAAHRSLPLNTVVRVTNLLNGDSVVVTINDRGPYVGKRVIDLSEAAAKRISMTKKGLVPVRIETLRPT